ncbi:MAG: hypothetical protein M3203_04250, partial [Actinomycetota bacterium]|nr:hypothetical protein [Actinomycetota bacterium]
FRCVAFRAGTSTLLISRNQRPFDRYFPEVVEGLLALAENRIVLDGEVVASGPGGLDFSALMLRLHPSPSRVARLRRETPASFVAFDLLAGGDQDLRPRPLTERRAHLEELLAGAPPVISVTPGTGDHSVAVSWLQRFTGGGIDGVVAKENGSAYETGRRSKAWLKAKPGRTADCVVGGFRGSRTARSSPRCSSGCTTPTVTFATSAWLRRSRSRAAGSWWRSCGRRPRRSPATRGSMGSPWSAGRWGG